MLKMIPPGIKRSIRTLALKGNNVECPVCGSTFITFLPFGEPPYQIRPNALCPNCKSVERTRIFWKYLHSIPGFMDTPRKILHVAPEKQLFRLFASNPNFDYVAVDKFTEGYSYPEGTRDMDITEIDFPDNSFDFVLCSHVLEHIPDDLKAMRELFRVMKTGGWGILQVPIDLNRQTTYEDSSITSPEERKSAFGQFDHVRWYGLDYKDRLASAGFRVEIDDYALKLPADQRFRFGLGLGEDLYTVRKL